MTRWDAWRGCHRCSPGCRFCYIHKGDEKRGIDTNQIVRSEKFYRPIEKDKKGEYIVKPGLVYVCFSSDFLIEEADDWRKEAWEIMRQRQDCDFLFLTKRITRFMDCVPEDWGEGYPNVTVCCTVENQQTADVRLPLFQTLPIAHRMITAQPLLGDIDLERYLCGIEAVTVGGESDREARVLDYDWVLHIRQQCVRQNVSFSFRQAGTHFLKDGVLSKINPFYLSKTARACAIDFQRN